MSTATKAFLLLYTTVLLLCIIHRLSHLYVYKADYAGGYTVHLLFVKEYLSIFSGYPDEYSDSPHDSFNDQQKHLSPAVDEKDVVVLSEKNFSYFVGKNRHMMVNFHAPCCYWSKKLAPGYAMAATELRGEMVLAKVNAIVERRLAMKYGIQAYPTVCFFVGGVKMQVYYHNRTKDAIANWTRTMIALGSYSISTTEQAEQVLMAESTIVLGFLDSLQGLEAEELAAASKLHSDVIFYQTTSTDVAKAFQIDPQIKRPALILLEKEAQDLSHYNGPFIKSAIADFISVNKIPPLTTLTEENALLILNSRMKQVWLFALAHEYNVTSIFQETAKAFKGKLLFVYVQMDGKGARRHIARDFGITGHAPRGPRVVAYTANVNKKCALNDELTLSNIKGTLLLGSVSDQSTKSFAENFIEDKLSCQSDTVSTLDFHHYNTATSTHTLASDPTSCL